MDSSTPPPLRKTFDVSIQAHRGFNAQYPENTLLSFEKAIEAKADYIELDVRASSDNHVVVMHDLDTERVAVDSQPLIIADSTLEQIKSIQLPENQKVPTLREVCKLCQGKIGLNIEITQLGITSLVNDIVHEFGMEKDVMISSFLHGELGLMHKLNPLLMCATLEAKGGRVKGYIKKSLKVNACGLNPHHTDFSPSLCTQAHENGLYFHPWTVNDPKIWDEMVAAGVDGIITDNPQALYDYLQDKAVNS